MTPAHVVEITTPKKVRLYGLWFGPKKSKRTVVWVHGLGSSMFSKLAITDRLVHKKTAVLVFNNRGHDKVAAVPTTGKRRIRGGAAHEVFTDCTDDIQGAINFAHKRGVEDIFLAGHSTGCQKSAYWAARKGKGVKGIMLLAPMSDYAAEVKLEGKKGIERGLRAARALIKSRKSRELLPEHAWRWSLLADAQRFMSLYSGKSAEEIFTYWAPEQTPKILRSIKIPTLVLLAQGDEYADRPAKEIGRWFEKYLRNGRIVVMPRAKHSFKGTEKAVARVIQDFMKKTLR